MMIQFEMLAVSAVLLVGILLTIQCCRKNTKAVMNRLIQKLDLAMEGRYSEIPYDENMESLIDNKLNRYMEVISENQMRSEKEKEAVKSLVSDITHQTKTPIANILLQAQLAREQKSLPQEVYSSLEQINQQAEKLHFLIDSLVKASYLEGGLIQIHAVHEELFVLVADVVHEYEQKAREKGISLKKAWPTELDSSCRYDYKWTKEALGNILDNAVKYSEGNSDITIHIEKLEMFLRVDIADSGMGIREEELGRIFTRFYRSPDTGKKPGAGIGLYLAREILSMQGGFIKVASKLGKGSVFSIYLPR